ncbi:TetR/AcrR family transcriptional regulator [Streptomyces sp. MP131-18]|uniref:TetR/AcrR family transcriptional regulator n=1 Tax=Streptomyces sp. MP131-18 TaxID=1857892 RepID=UPI00097C3069|nr:TetR/AcrR family transcriptional regulator [Streptomyces sp. MP131-18]ONK15363.1 Bacterial regulatory protein, tetR family [Streptomyces sp. MP131-18]
MPEERPLRADARRNRARVLAVAIDTFAAEGMSVPVHEIARRAGVGTGTVSRHFPTKEALYEAIVRERVGQIVGDGRALLEHGDPAEGFFAFFRLMAEQGAADRGLAEGLAGVGFDMEAAAARGGYDVTGVWRELLARAQRAGAVRGDVEVADVKALLSGCVARERSGPEPAARERMIAIVRGGLRPAAPA